MTDVRSRNAPWCPPHSFSPVANTSSLNFLSTVMVSAKGFINSLSKIRSFSPLSEALLSNRVRVTTFKFMISWIAHRSLPFFDFHFVVWRISPSITLIGGGLLHCQWIGITSAANWRTRSRLLYIHPPLKPSTSTKSTCRSCSSTASTLPNWSCTTSRPTNLLASSQDCWRRQLRREWQQQFLPLWLTTVNWHTTLGQCTVRDFLYLLICH